MSEPLRQLVISSDIPHDKMEALMPDRLANSGWEVRYNPPLGTECDFWIVFSVVRNREWMRCAPANTLYLAGEPPSKKVHPAAFYAQFAKVVSLNPADPHPNLSVECPCLNWHIGLNHRSQCYDYGYAELKAMEPPEKKDQISVVCSDLRTTEGQRERLTFLEALKERLGERLVHFGRGFKPIDDKMDAIRPFACHLVLENERTPHYWTEKLADAYLGFAYPLYLGAPNIGEYFPSDAYSTVDPGQVDAAVSEIERVLDMEPAGRMRAVLAARDLVLDRYNFFTNAVRLAEKHYRPMVATGAPVIWSHKAFRSFPRQWIFRLKQRLGKKDFGADSSVGQG